MYISLYSISLQSLFARVGVGIMGAILILFVISMIVRGRNVKGLPNTLRGEISKLSGLPSDVDPYVVVSSMGEMAHRTEFIMRPGEVAVYDEPFTWSVAPNHLQKFRTSGKVRFEVFDMKGSTYSVADPSLGAVEIPVTELYTEGQIERIEALRLRTKKGVAINVKVGIFAEHFFFQSLNRFVQYWLLRQREYSFWARVLSIPLTVFLITVGLGYFYSVGDYKTLGICDIVVGSLIGFSVLPHALHWIGIRFLDGIRMGSLLSASSLYLSCASTMIAISRYFGPRDPLDTLDHFLLILAMCVVSLLFLVGDFRGEPGASCLGRTIGSLFSTLCCCFGGGRAALLRAAI